MTMFAQLQTETPAPYLVVDLGEGTEWLSSRLFVFAVLLRAMRQTETFVFVETQGGTRGRFLGFASTQQTRWALAHAYPWLEADYAQACAEVTLPQRTPNHGVEPFVVDETGRLTHGVAHQIATKFVFAVQVPPPTAPASAASEWVRSEASG